MWSITRMTSGAWKPGWTLPGYSLMTQSLKKLTLLTMSQPIDSSLDPSSAVWPGSKQRSYDSEEASCVHNYVSNRCSLIIIIIKRLLWRQYPRKIRGQWRNKTKGLGILVTMYNAKSRQPMDGGAKKPRRIGHFEKIGFQITAKWSYISCWFYAVGEWIPQGWCGNRESSSSSLNTPSDGKLYLSRSSGDPLSCIVRNITLL